MIHLYPYKQLQTGQYTKWKVSITTNGSVIVERFFKGRRKLLKALQTRQDIKASDLPKNVKESALWALYEGKQLSQG